jgi:hypothetical protein
MIFKFVKGVIFVIIYSYYSLAFADNTFSLIPLIHPNIVTDQSNILNDQQSLPQPESLSTIFLQEDFSNGIPSTWLNPNGTANGLVDSDVKWEYRGTNTTPNNTAGSRGGYTGPAGGPSAPIQSPTRHNGFVIFDSDFLDNGGVTLGWGGGTGVSPHFATLCSPNFNLTGFYDVEILFYQLYRRFRGPGMSQLIPATYIDFSLDNGLTWGNTITLNSSIVFHGATTNPDFARVLLPVSVCNQPTVRFRFRFEGTYYFWQLDDVTVRTTSNHQIDPLAIDAIDTKSSSFEFNNQKNGITSLRQISPLSFSGKFINSGINNQTNVRLKVDVLKNNVLDTSLESGVLSNMASGTTHQHQINSNFKPRDTGLFVFKYTIVSDSTTCSLDSLWLYVTENYHGPDYKVKSNEIGTLTTSWGSGSYVSQMIRCSPDTLREVRLYLGSKTTINSTVSLNIDLLNPFSKVITANDTLKKYIDFVVPKIYLNGDHSFKFILNGQVMLQNDQTVSMETVRRSMYLNGMNANFSGYINNNNFNRIRFMLKFVPEPLASVVGNTTICSSDSVKIIGNNNYNNFTWSNGKTTKDIWVKNTGSYYLIATHLSTGKIDTSNIFFIQFNPVPNTIINTTSSVLCPNQTISITASGGSTYIWSNGSTQSSISANSPGIYFVAGTNQFGCTSYDTIQITSGTGPIISPVLSSAKNVICANDSVLISSSGVQNSTQNFWYLNGQLVNSSNNSIFAKIPGVYQLKSTNVSGCAYFSNSINLTNSNLTSNITSIAATCSNSANGSAILTPSGGVLPYNIVWNNGAVTSSIVGVFPGVYQAIVSDGAGCVVSKQITVTSNSQSPMPVIVAGSQSLCSGQTTLVQTLNQYTTYLWGGGTNSSQAAISVGPGTYWVLVTNNAGCNGSDTITISGSTPYTTQPELCVLTNDPANGFNKLKWERTSKQGVKYYHIYRSSLIGYNKIATKGVNQLSEYTDNTVNPNVQSYSYYLTIEDSCGSEHGDQSKSHQSIYLQSNLGTAGEINLLWTSYFGATPLYYKILRKSASSTIYVPIDSVNLASNSYTDFSPPPGITRYQIAAVMPFTCQATSKNTTETSLSNPTSQNIISITENNDQQFTLYPNPTSNQIEVNFNNQSIFKSLTLYNYVGQAVLFSDITSSKYHLDLSTFPTGTYYLKLDKTNSESVIEKIIKL